MEIRKRFSPREGVPAVTGGKCRVQQHFKDECDVNYVIRNFLRTGVLPLSRSTPSYIDCTDAPTYQESLDRINQVNTWFESLPSATRALFNNDPGLCIEHLHSDNPDLELLKKAGFILEQDKPKSMPDSRIADADFRQPPEKTGESTD